MTGRPMFKVLDLFSGIGGFYLGLGNAVVPQIPELIGRAILDHHQKETT